MIRQFELVERVKAYDPSADEDALNRAYVFAMKAHGSQSRDSGDPYFSHPLGVAELLARMKLDSASIVTGLLHDTVEDTDATLEQIEHHFGKEIARLVDGVTKLSRIELQSDHTKHAENFRKLVLAMSADIRVLLVKLADRLHNMQTLNFIKDVDKRKRIALETLEIYAPLAERMGMQQMKDELENLAFAELYPDAKESIAHRLKYLREQGGEIVPRIIAELKRTLDAAGTEYIAVIDWGDGGPTTTVDSTSGGISLLSTGAGGSVWSVQSSHGYAEEGSYSTTVRVTHDAVAPTAAVATDSTITMITSSRKNASRHVK